MKENEHNCNNFPAILCVCILYIVDECVCMCICAKNNAKLFLFLLFLLRLGSAQAAIKICPAVNEMDSNCDSDNRRASAPKTITHIHTNQYTPYMYVYPNPMKL